MPTMVTGDRLQEAVEVGSFIEDGDVASVEAVKYDFHMGSRVLKALYGQPKDIETIPEEERWVDPGEAVFLLTREKLKLPANMTATLTPKRKLAHAGIMMLGGLAVDPCYRGHLLLGLYNFSSTRYPLRPGAKLIGAMFYELETSEACDDRSVPEEVVDFPDDLVRLISNYKPVELKGLQDALSETQRQLVGLKADLTNDKQWRDDFRESLQKHDQQLGSLIQLLEKEQGIRSQEDEKIKSKLESMSNMFFGLRLVWAALIAIAVLFIGAFLGYVIPKAMDGRAPRNDQPIVSTGPQSSNNTTQRQ
jgi:dUTPase